MSPARQQLTPHEVFARALADEPPMPDLVGAVVGRRTRRRRTRPLGGLAAAAAAAAVAVGAAVLPGTGVLRGDRPDPATGPAPLTRAQALDVLHDRVSALVGAALPTGARPDTAVAPDVSIATATEWVYDGVWSDAAGRGDLRVGLSRGAAEDVPRCSALGVATLGCGAVTGPAGRGVVYGTSADVAGPETTVVVLLRSPDGWLVDVRAGANGRLAFPGDGGGGAAADTSRTERPAPLLDRAGAQALAVAVLGEPVLAERLADADRVLDVAPFARTTGGTAGGTTGGTAP